MSLAVLPVRDGEEVFCGCGGLIRFSVRVIYGAVVFIKAVF